MKKIFQLLCLITLFSVIFFGCRKDKQLNLQIYTPYTDVINPPDTFIYYIPLTYNLTLQGKVQFRTDGVWQISKTSGIGTSTWLSRADNPAIFGLTIEDTVALQGGYPYYLAASNANTPDGAKIYFQFTRLNKNYQTFSPKY